MNVTRIEYDEKTNTYSFYFDDGILLRVILDNRWIYRNIELEYLKFNNHNLDYDLQPYYQYDSKGKLRIGFANKDLLIDANIMSYWYYILTNVMSFIRYYPSTGEWIDPFKPCYEKHELMDIKHKLHNLRKTSTIKWGHLDIIRNVDQYNRYCKVNKFARESLINFYSRFLKLSRLKNNKTLSWILDATESFLNYGIVLPDELLQSKCDAPKCKQFGCILCGVGEKTFTTINSDEADSFGVIKREDLVCEYQEPHPTDDVKWCKHVQFYYPKNRWNKRIGVRQKTSEIMKMQLTNEQFVWNGKCSWIVADRYKYRITIKSKALSAFEQMVNQTFIMQQYLDGKLHSNSTVVSLSKMRLEAKYIIHEPNVTWLLRFLVLNKSYLGTFIMKGDLSPSHINALLKVAQTHDECISGQLIRLKDLLLKRKLLSV